MTEDELLEHARRLFHAGSLDEAGAAILDVPDDLIPRVVDLVNEMEARRREYLAMTDGLIAEHGHIIQSVMASDTTPWFAYSVGLYPTQPAEFIVRGFGESTNDLAYAVIRWVDEGLIELTPGDYTFPEGGKVRVTPWAGQWADVARANNHHRAQGRDHFPVMHIVIADEEGRFPGDPGCTVAEHQLRGIPAP